MYDETKEKSLRKIAETMLEMYGLTKGARVPSTRETEDTPNVSGDTVEERLRISYRERVRMNRRERKRMRKLNRRRRREACGYVHKLTRHHRLPRSHGGSDYNGNVILVDEKKHRAYHTLFENYSPEVVAQILMDTWLPVGTKLIVVKS